MLPRLGIAFSVVLVTALLVAIAVTLTLASDPFEQPGTTWSQGMLAGEDIRLLDSGAYAAREWCDICADEISLGSWHRDGNEIRLRPTKPKGPERTLRVFTVENCTFLAPDSDKWRTRGRPNPFMVYTESGNGCVHEL